MSTGKGAKARSQVLLPQIHAAQHKSNMFSGANIFVIFSEGLVHVTYDTNKLEADQDFILAHDRAGLCQLVDWYVSCLEKDLDAFRAVKRRILAGGA